MEKSLTGEPDAGNPPVRFGGRGGVKTPSLPLFLTGEPDAGNPPVRFGGRGGVKTPSLPLSVVRPHKTNPAPSRHERAYVAPTELVIFCGRMFYKDVAPLALRNGRARQSSARRASADQRPCARVLPPGPAKARDTKLDSLHAVIRMPFVMTDVQHPQAIASNFIENYFHDARSRATAAQNSSAEIGLTRPESSSSRRRAASATPSSVASSSLCGGNESRSHAANDPRFRSGNSANACPRAQRTDAFCVLTFARLRRPAQTGSFTACR